MSVPVLDGIRERSGPGASVRYAEGCGRKDSGGGESAIGEAVRLARVSDLAVVAAGIDRTLDEMLGRLQPLGEAVGDEVVVALSERGYSFSRLAETPIFLRLCHSLVVEL